MTTYSFPERLGGRLTIDTLHRLRAQIRAELRDPGPYTLIVTPGQWHDLVREIERDRWWYDRGLSVGRAGREFTIMDFTIVIPAEIRPRDQRIRGLEIDYAAIDDGRINVFDRILDQIRAADIVRWTRELDPQPAPRPEPATTHKNWGS